MFQQAMKDLRGDAVLAPDGRIGALDDIYFDGDCWQVRYLVVATGAGLREPHVLISVACVAGTAPAHDGVLVGLSRTQLELGAGIWPLDAAARWLDRARVCSGRTLVGFRVQAEDGAAGRVADLLVDDEEWSIHYMIVDTGGAKQVLMPLDWVCAIDPERRAVRMCRTREELSDAPAL
jgi:hypothetical protein